LEYRVYYIENVLWRGSRFPPTREMLLAIMMMIHSFVIIPSIHCCYEDADGRSYPVITGMARIDATR
jgi:hypothetical protein